MKVIEIARIGDLPPGIRKEQKETVQHCRTRQLKRAKPRRFLFSVRDPTVGDFNHVLQIDGVNLVHGNVLHVTDVGTGFQNGSFINKMDAETAWKMLRRRWINAYTGAPDYIHTDAESNFNSEVFKKNANAMCTIVKIAPTEGHDRIGVVERSHG